MISMSIELNCLIHLPPGLGYGPEVLAKCMVIVIRITATTVSIIEKVRKDSIVT